MLAVFFLVCEQCSKQGKQRSREFYLPRDFSQGGSSEILSKKINPLKIFLTKTRFFTFCPGSFDFASQKHFADKRIIGGEIILENMVKQILCFGIQRKTFAIAHNSVK